MEDRRLSELIDCQSQYKCILSGVRTPAAATNAFRESTSGARPTDRVLVTVISGTKGKNYVRGSMHALGLHVRDVLGIGLISKSDPASGWNNAVAKDSRPAVHRIQWRCFIAVYMPMNRFEVSYVGNTGLVFSYLSRIDHTKDTHVVLVHAFCSLRVALRKCDVWLKEDIK